MFITKHLAASYSSKKWHINFLKYIFSVTYFIAFLYLVFFAKRRRHQSDYFLNIVPLKNTFKGWANINYSIGREVFSFYSNLVGNVVLFIPFSIISVVVFNIQSRARIILLSFGLSFVVELLQYVFRVGVADIDDILLNVTGALIGIVICNVFKKSRQISAS